MRGPQLLRQMLSRSTLTGIRSNPKWRRGDAGGTFYRAAATAVIPKGEPPKYNNVPFEQEDMEKVMAEVPDIHFYVMGDQDATVYPFANVPFDQPVISTDLVKPSTNVPKMECSLLENGVRILSIDKGDLVASIGLFVNAGSRLEGPHNFGVSHMIETMAFHSTAHLSYLRQVKTIEVLGASASCIAGREHMMYQVECLRQYVPLTLPMLIGNTLFPRFLPWEVKDAKVPLLRHNRKLEKQPDTILTELLHVHAYHDNTLGNRLYATEKSLSHFKADVMRQFMLDYFSADQTVVVGVNVEHSELAKWCMRSYLDYNVIQPSNAPRSKPQYTGGDGRLESSITPLTHLAIAFESGGWNSDSVVPLTVLHCLLGGGGAFSTGGPGKGMHTRLFLNVLHRCNWVETCMAFNAMYTDSGLFGLYMVASPGKGPSAVETLVKEIRSMGAVTDEELKRAKNGLRASVWMNLENRPLMMEDMGRQTLMTGRVVGGHELCAAIEAVTADDIKRAVTQLLQKPPTVAVYGDVAGVPHYDSIVKMLK